MFMPSRASLAGAAALLLAAAPLAHAKTVSISGQFAAEGSATSQPTGHVTGSFDTVTRKLTYKITYHGLSGPVKAAHFHGPAAPGQTAGVLLPIPGPYHTGMHGTLTANDATTKALLAGQTYVNLHTAKYPMGEARAQISVGQ
ncbi:MULTISPECIES: CHRD domain-containing protein [unclassified Acidocella]|uniref:CHRD domain-containing protein n=1 Tax=unclassified Acidocella TaxID=2648610 RepID=UPI00028E5E04|nr:MULTISPECIES: CHRD domain-containing protein [unclassified Acidocella]EKM98248.1 CHRD domain-containing protein [Acidocella sp. MX-AZ02]WBO59381.1 CHRD domain-containing protein [Acidocella sp. MX-AZ03]